MPQPDPSATLPQPPSILPTTLESELPTATPASAPELAESSTPAPSPPPSVILSQKDYPQRTYYALSVPTDPLYPLWHFTAIESVNAWSFDVPATVVAVIDNGFALAHEDLQDRWQTNPGELGTTSFGSPCWDGSVKNKQSNNCDDDGNGYVDDWRGWDFYHDDNSPQAGQDAATSVTGHGTNVSGLIGAAWNNKGLPGINPNVRILPLQSLGDSGSGSNFDIVRAVEYAVDQGADVINLSLGGSYDDEAMEAAVEYADEHGVVIVAASGNCAANPERPECEDLTGPGYMTYPALYEKVIAVGATNSSNNRASFSSYGAELDLVAPGSSISYSTGWTPTNQTSAYSTNISGTSFSAPLVSGVAAMMRAQDPSLTPHQIETLLHASSDIVSGMSGQPRTDQYGWGRLNAFKAISMARAHPVTLSLNAGAVPGRKDIAVLRVAVGASFGRPAKTTDRLQLACLSEPGTLCQLELYNQTSPTSKTVAGEKVPDSGILTWIIDPLSAGTWTVTAHNQTGASVPALIYVQ